MSMVWGICISGSVCYHFEGIEDFEIKLTIDNWYKLDYDDSAW